MKHEPIPPEEIERMLADEPDSLPPELEARMRARLQTLERRIDTASVPKPEHEESWIMKIIQNMKQGQVRWAMASAMAAVLLIVAYVVIGGGPSASSYAAVVERLQKDMDKTFKVNVKITGVPNVPEMNVVVYHKNPGLARLEQTGGAVGTITIVNVGAGKILSLNPEIHKALMIDLGNWKASDQANNYLTRLDELKTLPSSADESMVQTIDGRAVNVYLVKNDKEEKFLWIDQATGALVRYVIKYPKEATAPEVEMSGFQFDAPIDDALFSIVPPAGYDEIKMADGRAPDWSSASEAQLVDYLKMYLEATNAFPTVLDPGRPFENSQVMADAFQKFARARGRRGQEMTEQQEMQDGMKYAMGVAFIAKMKAGNDYHYAGHTTAPGNAADWIVWYKADGATTYRVIHGDMSVTDETAEAAAGHATAK